MQEGEGKAACKSDKIVSTPARGHSAEVTPCPTANERVQTKAKKKKGLGGYFGTGARMLPPNLKGTPFDAVGKRRGGEDKANNCTREEGECSLEPKVDGYKAKSNKGGEANRGGTKRNLQSSLRSHPAKAQTTDTPDKARRPDRMMKFHSRMSQVTANLQIWRRQRDYSKEGVRHTLTQGIREEK